MADTDVTDEVVADENSSGMEGPLQWREHMAALRAEREGDTATTDNGAEDGLDDMVKDELLATAETEGVEGVNSHSTNAEIIEAIRAKRSA